MRLQTFFAACGVAALLAGVAPAVQAQDMPPPGHRMMRHDRMMRHHDHRMMHHDRMMMRHERMMRHHHRMMRHHRHMMHDGM